MKSTFFYQPKVWGLTVQFVRHPVFSAHHIIVNPGTFCSVHRHAHRVNSFFVLKGTLIVRVWNNEHAPDDCLLLAGQGCEVPPNVYHQFRSETGAEVIETYFPILPTDDDIHRISEGGLMYPKENPEGGESIG